MHVEYPRQVVRREFTLEPKSFQRRQCVPSIVDGEEQGESWGMVQKVCELRGENPVEVGQARMTRDDSRCIGTNISTA